MTLRSQLFRTMPHSPASDERFRRMGQGFYDRPPMAKKELVIEHEMFGQIV
jgi:hypothetical protein